MLLIETYLKHVDGKGLGLFSREFIPKNTIWWIRDEKFDRVITSNDLIKYDALQRRFIEMYGALEVNGSWYVCLDNARFVNHSDKIQSENTFNNLSLLENCYFIKDVLPDEEIVCDYRTWCYASKENLGFKNIE
jgi:hypothetical protein